MLPAKSNEKKGDVATLKSKLQDAFNKRDIRSMKATVKKIIALMTLGIDVSSIFPEMIMVKGMFQDVDIKFQASATSDIVLKKLVYLYICSCAESNQDLAVLTVNSLVKDAQRDANPMIRGLALRSMFNIRIQSLIQYMKDPLKFGLNDTSSYVRRNAVMASLKLFNMAPNVFEDMDLLPKLFNLVRDGDAQVSIDAFIAVDEILATSGGFPFDKDYVMYFLESCHRLQLIYGRVLYVTFYRKKVLHKTLTSKIRLPKYNEWGQCTLLHNLIKYQPADDDEVIECLNFLDSRLKHANKAVVMSSINLFLQYTKNMESIRADVFERIKGPIITMLSATSPEVVFTILNHVMVLTYLRPRLFYKDYKMFFLRDNEPVYVLHKKLDVLTEIVTEGNLQNILDELSLDRKTYAMDVFLIKQWYVRDSDVSIATKAIKCIGKIASKTTISMQPCIQSIIEILRLEVDHITSNCLEILQELMLLDSSVALQVLPELSSCWEQVQDHAQGKAAIIWIYGEYGEDIPTSPYHLEEVVDNIEEEQSCVVKSNLLSALMKLFFKRPPECRKTLETMLKYCIDEENDMDIRDRALFYYRLLRNVEQARAVLQESSNIQDTMHRNENLMSVLSIEDFRFREFNTLSIIYDEPSSSFITNTEWMNHALPTSDTEDADGDYESRIVDEPVIEGVILDIDSTVEEKFEQHSFEFDNTYVMQKNEFQSLWSKCENSLQIEKDLTVNPEHDEISSVMHAVGIKVMASSPSNAPSWKFFLYSKDKNDAVTYMIQLDVILQQRKLLITIKTTGVNKLKSFTEFFKNLFVGRWIAYSP